MKTALSNRETVRVADCSFGEQLLLWAMRVWALDYGVNKPPSNLINEAFEQAYISHGGRDVDRLMTALAAGAVRSLGLQCTCATHLTKDEQRLLRIFSVAQSGASHVYGLLRVAHMGSPYAVPMIARSAEYLACNLASVGMALPSRCEWDGLFFQASFPQPTGQNAPTTH